MLPQPRRRRPVPRIAIALIAAALVCSGGGPAAAIETPPPTPVDGKPSPFVTKLETPAPSTALPQIRAPVGLLADMQTGQVLFAKGEDRRRPIASLTKMMTALLVLERTEPDDIVTVSRNAAPSITGYHGSELDLRPGEEISVDDLLHALLIQSANDAAVALAEHVAGSTTRFVRLMNSKAARLGMRDTEFASTNGLIDSGYSTAGDLLLLTQAAYGFPRFADIVKKQFFEIPSPGGRERRVQNRNVLLWLYPGAIGVKTGYTVGARFCLVALAARQDLRLLAVVLGAPEEPFSDTATLLDYGFGAFERRAFVEAGEPLGTVEIPGGRVGGATAGELEALVPAEVADRATREIIVDRGVRFPPRPGEQIGVLQVAVPGLVIGSVPVIAAAVPPPPPPDPGPWWRRTADALVGAVDAVLGGLFG